MFHIMKSTLNVPYCTSTLTSCRRRFCCRQTLPIRKKMAGNSRNSSLYTSISTSSQLILYLIFLLIVCITESTQQECDRCTSGDSFKTVVNKRPQTDCPTGHWKPILTNDLCDCDYVCARESRQSCRLTHSKNALILNQTLCDSSLNLVCNEKTDRCEGPLSLFISNVRHQSFYVNWHSQQSSLNGTNGNAIPVSIEVANYTSPNVGEASFVVVKAYITKSGEPNKLNAKVDDLKANTTYIIKVKDNGKHEFAIVRTDANPLVETLPKVLVTKRNESSISIAFDDFKPPHYDLGYGIKFRSISSDSSVTNKNISWNIVSSNNTPFYVLSKLKPNTNYQIQVFTWEKLGDQIRSQSEMINTTTLDGCIDEGKTYTTGETVVSNCDQTCTCSPGGSLFCIERCLQPYISTNVAKSNKNVDCVPHVTDQCCVRCTSSSSSSSSSSSPSSILNESKKFIDKPGECFRPIATTTNSSSINCASSIETMVNECAHDYHCTGFKKCCANVCGQLVCQESTNSSITETISKCTFKCGPNARCEYNAEESAPKCVCIDGFQGEEPIHGCHRKPTRMHQCSFEGKQLDIGQTIEHQCQSCLCSEALEVECKSKCEQSTNNNTIIESNCRLVPDPIDPACCKKQVCDPLPVIAKPSNANHSFFHSGCKHMNQIFRVNQSFHIDCELKCLCKGNDEVECAPRCYADPGYDENFCYLVDDPDDPECCKISICDHSSGNAIKDHFIIEMAEAINSTSLKLRLQNVPSIGSGSSIGTVFYSKVSPNETNEHDESKRNWTMTDIIRETTTILSNKSAEVLVTNLAPETDYLLYFKQDNMTTNNVMVRTYPNGINNTFKGCFHGNQIIEVGEQYYEGDCEFKCICREGGIRECEERCPVFVDLIGYENCQWEPSSEDSCCTVPVCNQSEHLSHLECVSTDGKHFKVGDTWSIGSGCLQKTCHCAVDRNGTATINCKGGCPIIPQSVIEPNDICRSPKVIQPENPCVCPYVVCDNNINPLDLPEKSTPKGGMEKFCEFKGEQIAIGKEFYDNCRAICRCEVGGVIDCHPIQCSRAFGPHTTKCLEWDIDPHFLPVAPNCCPEPKCKNDGSCSFAGIRFGNFKHIPQELLPCGKRCQCNNGQIRCENMCPDVADQPPHGLPCPASLAFRGYLPGDKCCIHWQCRDIYQDRMKGSCVYKDSRYKLGEQWDETESGIKRRCHCKLTNGILHVSCNPGNCQPITERYLEPTQECAIPTVVVPKDPIMCPYVICNNTKAEGGELENVDIVAINATSARIRFTIPNLYVGLLGHAEVHYTTDVNIARNQWNIQKFARPKRMFDIPNIEYHLGNLKPDTTYFLQIEVIIEALKSGPTSEIFKLYQPPLPMVTSTTTTTTTSTLPPIIMLDMQLNGKALDSSSVKIDWRSFSPQERKFIDAIQIRYKKAEQDGGDWSYSPMLHRNTRQYVLDRLESGMTYAIDLIFTSVEGINTNIVSTKPVVVDVPSLPKDEYQFDVHIFPDDVTINDGQIDIEIHNLPRPVSKYVNVAKLFYQNMETSQMMYDYINIDESAKISFSNLHSNTRYKVWVDFFLTNGQIISSNSIEIITKYKQRSLDDNDIGALTGNRLVESKYLFVFMVISVFVFVTGATFMVATCIFMRKHSTASISRVCISEAAYDNPTYKTFESGEKCLDDSLSRGTTIPAK